jgi:hypothetical protein
MRASQEVTRKQVPRMCYCSNSHRREQSEKNSPAPLPTRPKACTHPFLRVKDVDVFVAAVPVHALSMKELQQMLWQMKQMQQMQIYQTEVQVHQQEVRQEVRICMHGAPLPARSTPRVL